MMYHDVPTSPSRNTNEIEAEKKREKLSLNRRKVLCPVICYVQYIDVHVQYTCIIATSSQYTGKCMLKTYKTFLLPGDFQTEQLQPIPPLSVDNSGDIYVSINSTVHRVMSSVYEML